MPKYIDADRFERVLMGLGEDILCDDCCCEVLIRLDDAPAADVAPVKHGRNVKEDYPSLFECTLCGWQCNDTYPGDTSEYRFCPNCGARMEKGG